MSCVDVVPPPPRTRSACERERGGAAGGSARITRPAASPPELHGRRLLSGSDVLHLAPRSGRARRPSGAGAHRHQHEVRVDVRTNARRHQNQRARPRSQHQPDPNPPGAPSRETAWSRRLASASGSSGHHLDSTRCPLGSGLHRDITVRRKRGSTCRRRAPRASFDHGAEPGRPARRRPELHE